MPRFEKALEDVQRDIASGIEKVFAPAEGSIVEPPPELVAHLEGTEAAVVAVPWVYRCVHVGDFQKLLPTGREIEMHGVTFVNYTQGEENPTFHRYVDWLGVVNQLGLEVSWRAPIEEHEYGDRLRDYRRMVREP
jgi:hypothetical protein